FREFHLGGDMLVIYQFKEYEFVLTRIGTHSQLFR
ncbi:MAG: type II toxin-antitoxin system mRNA interferase toxin, RelE/StbE family, partial [Thiothrix sp.]